MEGVKAKASWEEIPPAEIPIMVRLSNTANGHSSSTSAITALGKADLAILEVNVPWTPGRLPLWK